MTPCFFSFKTSTRKMNELRFETICFDQRKYEEAESLFYKTASCSSHVHAKQDPQASTHPSSIVDQIAKARETIQQTLKGESVRTSVPDTSSATGPNVDKRLDTLEKENEALKQAISCINANLSKLEARINQIDISKEKINGVSSAVSSNVEDKTKIQPPDDDDDDDDDDIDLFGSDDEDEEAANAIRQQRVKAYAEKKAKKAQVVAKSNIILDVKPWDDETDMALLTEHVRSVSCDGLVWGQSKLVPVGYGINKLQISCVVEDDKCGTDFLEEEITKFEDFVQSVDIAAFNKV